MVITDEGDAPNLTRGLDDELRVYDVNAKGRVVLRLSFRPRRSDHFRWQIDKLAIKDFNRDGAEEMIGYVGSFEAAAPTGLIPFALVWDPADARYRLCAGCATCKGGPQTDPSRCCASAGTGTRLRAAHGA